MQTEARVGVVVDGGGGRAAVERRQEQRHIGTAAHLAAGGFAGAVSKSCTAPLARLTILFQKTTRYYKGIFHAVSTICRDEGIKGLYKGLGATLLELQGVGPSIAISFSVYESLRSSWQMERCSPHDSTAVVSLFSGSLSGIASSTATFPLDLVKRRMQLKGAAGTASAHKSTITGTVRDILQKEGPRGFYRGIAPEYLKVVPSVGIAFMTYETLKSLLSSMDADDER
nr:unnamed protein product [Digitaria exilis]